MVVGERFGVGFLGLGKGKVVRGDDAAHAVLHQQVDEGTRADMAVVGVGAAQDLVE